MLIVPTSHRCGERKSRPVFHAHSVLWDYHVVANVAMAKQGIVDVVIGKQVMGQRLSEKFRLAFTRNCVCRCMADPQSIFWHRHPCHGFCRQYNERTSSIS